MDGPKGDFLRANLRNQNPEQQAIEKQSKEADRIADGIIDKSGVEPVGSKQDAEEAEAWSQVQGKGLEAVRDVILDGTFGEKAEAERLAHALLWNNLRGRE